MNLVTTAPVWLLIILGLVLAAAALEDAVRLRISNLTCAAVLLTALIAMGFAGIPWALWQNAVVFALVLALGTPLFAAGKIGGGDVKLLAVLGLWFDLAGALWLLIAVFLSGGVLALVFIVATYLRGRRVRREKTDSGGIPYGLAIVAGALIVFATQLQEANRPAPKPDPLKIRPLG
jgi:prepilin peptidase CpaA